jgi:aryl-alcohol dehydrogenase-like predicted oxidoreductase
MEHRRVGSSDLELPVITFGAWAIGGLFWGGSDDAEAVKAIEAAIDNGIDAIDTAPMYGCGHSELIVAKAIAGKHDKVKILTKCGLRWDSKAGEFFFTITAPDGSDIDCHKNVTGASIEYECEQSLKRLGVDVIDLYQVHWPSSSAPAEETMGALVRLKTQGKIRHIGLCNYTAAQLAEAMRFGPVVADQIKYNLVERDAEADPLPFCRDKSLGLIIYSPMAMGLLTGAATMQRKFSETDVRSRKEWFQPANRRRVLEALEKIRPIADAHKATLGQLSVAWVLAQPGITTALVGARTAAQVVENSGAARIRLGKDELATIRGTFEALGAPES